METSVSAPKTGGRARSPAAARRLKLVVHGAVQGVGFRPFVYRLAAELKLHGWVSNSTQGVFIEVEGTPDSLAEFHDRLRTEKPPRAVVEGIESSPLDAIGYQSFEIHESKQRGDKRTLILPDIATCADCLREIVDPTNRRFRYPFTNCTNCGPRFSIIEALPYDRANTSMKTFAMCIECDREYHDPLDRRFHAQPNACPKCGPQLQLWDENGSVVSECDDALAQAADQVRAGKILALKGVGGFQLIVDARDETAVMRLRKRKCREEKPFALMYPSLEAVRTDCEVSSLEERLLLSPESPIVLLTRNAGLQPADAPMLETSATNRQDVSVTIAPSVAPGNPNLGVMLPYSPLHHLLLRELNFPVIATSGNLSDEPICIDEREAKKRLDGIAEALLVHNRPIVRHMDDSVVRVMCGRKMILRRARGYAPLPIRIQSEIGNRKQKIVLSLGAHLKNTVALTIGDKVFVSQHIGDLETKEAYGAFSRAATDLPRLYDATIDVTACDMHPDYLSTKYADEFAGRAGSPPLVGDGARGVTRPTKIAVQHHFAHVAACMAENKIEPPVLGVAWDGTGYGLDGTIWGGEFLLVKADGAFERVAHLREFCLPGGDAAIRQPRRSALGMLYEVFGAQCWSFPHVTVGLPEDERRLLGQMLEKRINAPLTSSAGRLFDAVAAVMGVRQSASFEGQAAMELEFARQPDVRDAYSFWIKKAAPMVIDWEPMVRELLDDVARNVSRSVIAARFHNTLVEMIVAVTKKIGEVKIVLSGGCFQNRYLSERTVQRLREEKFQPYWHQHIPPNDGGIALGQAMAANWLTH
jgi:hydrogenase maturation protein HypF